MEVTAHQLKELDPKQFEKEYWWWCDHAFDYEWWEYIESDFIERCAPMGIRVDEIRFESRPWAAAFTGRVNVAQWMEHVGLHEKWYPLWLAAKADESCVVLTVSRRVLFVETDWYEYTTSTAPAGVFADMPADAWEELINDMWNQADLPGELDGFLRDLCRDLAHRLEEAYDHETSEESFLDSCEANEVTFDYQGDEGEIQS